MTRLTKSSYVKIVLVCLLCVLICGALTGGFSLIRNGIAAWLNPWDGENAWTPSERDQAGSFAVDADSVDSMSVNWLAGSLVIKVVPDSEANGSIEATESSDARFPIRWRSNNGTLEIDYGDIRNFMGCSLWSRSEKDLVITIPESRAAALSFISLNAASGKYEISGLTCDVLDIDQASGTMQIKDLSANNLFCSFASGSFSYEGNIMNMLDFEQASGRASLALRDSNPAQTTISMASGDFDLALPTPDFQIALEKLSGNFSSEYELLSNGNMYYGSLAAQTTSLPTTVIDLQILSGNFELKKSA